MSRDIENDGEASFSKEVLLSFLNFVMYLGNEAREYKFLSLNYCWIREINGGWEKMFIRSFRNCFSWKEEVVSNIYIKLVIN